MTVPHPARRLIAATIALVVVDRFVPVVRDRLENASYEKRSDTSRSENSDFFAIGPLVQYLREHPHGDRPRTVFIGNSVLYGYGLDPRDTVPAVYQRLSSGEKVYNASINGLDSVGAYLIAKSIVDSIDTAVLLNQQVSSIDRILLGLIPIDDSDLQQFKSARPAVSPLTPFASRWRLYRDSYRIQAALFATSTRQYLYLHKGELARRAVAAITRRGVADEFTPAEHASNLPSVAVTVPVSRISSESLASLERDNAVAVHLAQLFRERGKRLIFLQIRDYHPYLPEPLVAAFNAEFSPHAAIAVVDRPESARLDTVHFNRDGAAAMAQSLRGLADGRR